MKKHNKVLLTIFLVCLSIFCISISAFATSNEDIVVNLQIDNPMMKVNGVQTEIDDGRGTTPIVNGGRTIVPIRAIIEAFGGTVGWDDSTRTVTLAMDEDVIKLTIDSTIAYLNNQRTVLDVAPTVINGRTMLPIRFVAEGFNLGVAWENTTHTVSIISNGFDDAEYQIVKNLVPAYCGQPYVQINNNKPFFKDYEIIEGSFEFYADLDELGRCDVAMASIGTDLMPAQERESISSVTPTGWVNNRYDVVDGGYLYNRCHLIGFQLTGENANNRNLITGTRYLNIEGMLPFENMIDDYVESTNNNVVYRATPVFTGDNLVADGVLLEAYSVEDNGKGIMFCIYCYNVQPYISIDYSTGANALSGENFDTTIIPDDSTRPDDTINDAYKVYRTPTGKRYHLDAECGGKNSFETTLQDATSSGLTPCSKCAK